MSRDGLLLLATLLSCQPAPASLPAPRPPSSARAAPPPIATSAARARPPPLEEAEPAAPTEDRDPVKGLPGISFFPKRGEPGKVATMRCGDYTVERRDEAPVFGHVRVLGAKGKVAYDARPRTGFDTYDVGWCFDLTRDGVPELEITHRSCGAQCWHRTVVLSLGKRPTTMLDVDMGNADVHSPEDVDGRGAYELVGTDDVLVLHGSMAYAFTRRLPAIFTLEGTRYVRRTRRFPARLRAERDAAVNELHECEGDEECLRGMGGYLLGMSLLIGDWDARSRQLPLPASVIKELDGLRERVEQSLATRER